MQLDVESLQPFHDSQLSKIKALLNNETHQLATQQNLGERIKKDRKKKNMQEVKEKDSISSSHYDSDE